MTVTQSNVEDITLDAPEQPQPATRTVERGPGRPGRKAVTDGQVDIFGDVIEVREPERKSRSVWAESAPETLSETDDLDAVAEAAAEVVASDLDAELRRLNPEAGMHRWARMTRAAIAAAGELSHAEFRVLVIHLAQLAAEPEHCEPIWRLAEVYGISRVATMSEATSELVKKGWLHRRDRGWEDAGKRRPFGYRPTQRLLDLVERTGPIRSADRGTDAETEPVTPIRSADGGTPIRSADGIEAKASTSTTVPEPYEAAGACVECGGSVTTAPDGTANPRCKPCYVASKSRSRGRPDLEQHHRRQYAVLAPAQTATNAVETLTL